MDIFCLFELAWRTRYILGLRIMRYSQSALICERKKYCIEEWQAAGMSRLCDAG